MSVTNLVTRSPKFMLSLAANFDESPCSKAAFVVNSEPHTGARPLVCLVVGRADKFLALVPLSSKTSIMAQQRGLLSTPRRLRASSLRESVENYWAASNNSPLSLEVTPRWSKLFDDRAAAPSMPHTTTAVGLEHCFGYIFLRHLRYTQPTTSMSRTSRAVRSGPMSASLASGLKGRTLPVLDSCSVELQQKSLSKVVTVRRPFQWSRLSGRYDDPTYVTC